MGSHMMMVANDPDLADTNTTWTTFSDGMKDWLKSERGTVLRIEVLVGVVVMSMVFLATFGSLRRRRRNFLSQNVVLATYKSSSLVSYTLGLMQSSLVKSSMFPLWAISIYIIFGSADSITAYSLDDNTQGMGQIYHAFLCMFYLVSIAVTFLGKDISMLLFIEMVALAGVKWVQRSLACAMASGSLNLNLTKMVADYMYLEHTKSGSSYDPVSMNGYHYIVDWPLHESKVDAGILYATKVATKADAAQVIDIEKIYQCKRLSSEQMDACLSFSLFHLLRRRYFGFACYESSRQKTHDFVFKGLLAKNDCGAIDYNRVFKVIDIELAFMYDFFFTKYAAIYYGQRNISAIVTYALIILAFMSAAFALIPGLENTDVRNQSPVATTTTTGVVSTLLMIACIALLELLQLLHYWTTIWGKVYLACHCVREQQTLRSSEETPSHITIKICTSISNKCYYWSTRGNECNWQNKLGQYSLFESVCYNPSRSLLIRLKPRTKGKLIELPAEVKEALLQSLERTQGILTNGKSSLLFNGASDLLWACRLDNMQPASGMRNDQESDDNLLVDVILTWHIATGYCEMGANARGELNSHLDVATKLSKYCAYLVASAPKLLPGNDYGTTCVFRAVVEEVAGFLQSEQDEYKAMAMLSESLSKCAASVPEPYEKIFHRGVRLGQQLEGIEEGTRWKVLADFWAEMLLYIAPSDNVKEHIQSLANGGEFITHLWALLTHAGILRRGKRNSVANDIENAGAGRTYPREGHHDCTVGPGLPLQPAMTGNSTVQHSPHFSFFSEPKRLL